MLSITTYDPVRSVLYLLFIGLDIDNLTHIGECQPQFKNTCAVFWFLILTVCMVVYFVIVIFFVFLNLPSSLVNFFSYPVFIVSLVTKMFD